MGAMVSVNGGVGQHCSELLKRVNGGVVSVNGVLKRVNGGIGQGQWGRLKRVR